MSGVKLCLVCIFYGLIVCFLSSCKDAVLRRSGEIVVTSDSPIDAIAIHGAALTLLEKTSSGKWTIIVERVIDAPVKLTFYFSDKKVINHSVSEPILARKTSIKIHENRVNETIDTVYHL